MAKAIDHMAGTPRWLAGSFGGLAAAVTKYLGQHHSAVHDLIVADKYITAINYGLGYAVLTPLLMVLGSLVALFSSEQNRTRLFVMAIAAPALVTTISGGKAVNTVVELFGITPAYAQSQPVAQAESISVVQGVKYWFNWENELQYQVIVGSYKDPTAAAMKAREIMLEDPKLNVFVGPRMVDNQFYPVVVGGYQAPALALKLQDRVLKLKAVDGAFLSPKR